MIRLRILEILEEQNHSKYWLYKRMEMSYQNFNKIVNNDSTGNFLRIQKVQLRQAVLPEMLLLQHFLQTSL